jgi:hypothetical protein
MRRRKQEEEEVAGAASLKVDSSPMTSTAYITAEQGQGLRGKYTCIVKHQVKKERGCNSNSKKKKIY